MRNTLIALILLCGVTPALAQTPSGLQTETVAAVTTRTGMVQGICIKPMPGDDRPGTQYALVTERKTPGDAEVLTLLQLPQDVSQAAILSQFLDGCNQNGVGLTISGPLVKYSNNFGETTMLAVRRLEVNVRDPELRLRQTIIIVVED